MKKILLFLLVLLSLFSVFADKTASYVMLENYYVEDDFVSSYWDNASISLLTVSKDDPLYSWFGHSALLIELKGQDPIIVDYGRFSFSKDFYSNFAMGRLWYICGASDGESEIAYWKENKRSVSKVELNLTGRQKKALIEFLEINISDEHCTYLYHHYNDNCATRIRDIIDYVSDGSFRKWSESQSGLTMREETSRILHNNVFCQWALDFLQSSNIDKKATIWDDMFLPSELEKYLLEFNSDLVGERTLIADYSDDNSRPTDFEKPQSYELLALGFGILLAVVAYFVGRKTNFLNFVLNLVIGLLGSLLFFMMFFTSHDVTWGNINILYLNPLFLIAAFMFFKREKNERILVFFYRIVLTLLVINLIGNLIIPQIFVQVNTAQLLTLLPLYIVWAL